jgi:hypothetical protein
MDNSTAGTGPHVEFHGAFFDPENVLFDHFHLTWRQGFRPRSAQQLLIMYGQFQQNLAFFRAGC